MSSNSNNKGRAYEYAWINSLFNVLKDTRLTRIVKNTSFDANRRAWCSLDKKTQELYIISSEAAVNTILELEPRMLEDDGDELLLEFQQDSAGQRGDVRDILIKRNDIQWEAGLSIKHNHEAIKHSRLSYRLDFGNEWFGIPCSREYWKTVTPIFDRLMREKKQGKKWSELSDKESGIYMPLLYAFMNEIRKVCKRDRLVPQKMIEYLVGTNDYYKAVSHDNDRLTIIHTFNLHDTLNKPSKIKISAISVPIVELPSELVTIRFKTGSNNIVEMYLNNGWQLSFRIHNASTFVEPSLKFDVQFIGMPMSVLRIKCSWK